MIKFRFLFLIALVGFSFYTIFVVIDKQKSFLHISSAICGFLGF